MKSNEGIKPTKQTLEKRKQNSDELRRNASPLLTGDSFQSRQQNSSQVPELTWKDQFNVGISNAQGLLKSLVSDNKRPKVTDTNGDSGSLGSDNGSSSLDSVREVTPWLPSNNRDQGTSPGLNGLDERQKGHFRTIENDLEQIYQNCGNGKMSVGDFDTWIASKYQVLTGFLSQIQKAIEDKNAVITSQTEQININDRTIKDKDKDELQPLYQELVDLTASHSNEINKRDDISKEIEEAKQCLAEIQNNISINENRKRNSQQKWQEKNSELQTLQTLQTENTIIRELFPEISSEPSDLIESGSLDLVGSKIREKEQEITVIQHEIRVLALSLQHHQQQQIQKQQEISSLEYQKQQKDTTIQDKQNNINIKIAQKDLILQNIELLNRQTERYTCAIETFTSWIQQGHQTLAQIADLQANLQDRSHQIHDPISLSMEGIVLSTNQQDDLATAMSTPIKTRREVGSPPTSYQPEFCASNAHNPQDLFQGNATLEVLSDEIDKAGGFTKYLEQENLKLSNVGSASSIDSSSSPAVRESIELPMKVNSPQTYESLSYESVYGDRLEISSSLSKRAGDSHSKTVESDTEESRRKPPELSQAEQMALTKYEHNDPTRERRELTYLGAGPYQGKKFYLYPDANGRYDIKNTAICLALIDKNMDHIKLRNLNKRNSASDWTSILLQAEGTTKPTPDISQYEHNDPTRERRELTYLGAGSYHKKKFYLYPDANGKYDIKNTAICLALIDKNMDHIKLGHLNKRNSASDWTSILLQAEGTTKPTPDISQYEHNDPTRERRELTYLGAGSYHKKKFYLYPDANGKYDIKNTVPFLALIDKNMNYAKLRNLNAGSSALNWTSILLQAEGTTKPTPDISQYEHNDPTRERRELTYLGAGPYQGKKLYIYPNANGKYDIKNTVPFLALIDKNINYIKIRNLNAGKSVLDWTSILLQAKDITTTISNNIPV